MKQEGDTILYEGYCIDLLKELANILKFTYQLYPSPDGYYGAKSENGSWNGMIGELLKEVCKTVMMIYLVTQHVRRCVL